MPGPPSNRMPLAGLLVLASMKWEGMIDDLAGLVSAFQTH